MLKRLALASLMGGALTPAFAQNPPAPPPPPSAQAPQPPQPAFRQRDEPQANGTAFVVAPGTHVLLNMINSVSTKQAQVGDRIYLETAFPVLSGGHIVIPQGSWVTGTITEVKRPGRVHGRGELQVRFDSLTLPNGVSRNFRSDLGALDARNNETLKREQSKVSSPGDKAGDLGTVVGTTVSGTVIGSGIGAAAGNAARGAGIGAGAGAAAGLLGVLLTRGPDAMLTKGSTVEMVLDRSLTFQPSELDFSNAPPSRTLSQGGAPAPQQRRGLGSRLPFPY